MANQSSAWFLDEAGETFKVAYPKKGHYRFMQDYFTFKTMVFKYKIPEDGKSHFEFPEPAFKSKSKATDFEAQKKVANLTPEGTPKDQIRAPSQADKEMEVIDQSGINKIAQAMWGLALKYGYDRSENALILPDNGIEFVKSAPCLHSKLSVFGSQSDYQYYLRQGLFPMMIHRYKGFEELFLNDKESIRDHFPFTKEPLLKLIIGIPRFGNLKTLKVSNADIIFTKATTWSEYYIRRGIDLLLPGGILVYLLHADVEAGEQLFLQSGITDCKKAIDHKAELVDAWRLPTFYWSGQVLNTDILIMQKKRV